MLGLFWVLVFYFRGLRGGGRGVLNLGYMLLKLFLEIFFVVFMV